MHLPAVFRYALFAWTADIGPLDPGQHTLTAALVTGEATVADTATFTSS